MFLFLALASGLVSLWLLVQTFKPLLERGVVTAEDWTRLEDESMALLSRRDRLIEELRELEFEAALDKISVRDMRELRARYEREALDLSRKLDEGAEQVAQRIEAQIAGAPIVGAQKRAPSGAATEEAAAPAPEAGANKPSLKKTAEGGAQEPAKSGEGEAPQAAAQAAQEPAKSGEGAAQDASALATHCAHCETPLTAQARFCDHCGGRQDRSCACGATNRPEARFCRGCGDALVREERPT